MTRCAIAVGAGMAALHLLDKTTSHSTRLQRASAKSLVIPKSAGRNPYLNPLPEGEGEEAIALSPSGGKLDRGLASNVSEVQP
jgi:hypothetical protein